MISIPNKAVWPYVQQWHLDVQQEIAKNTVATVSYVGSKGTHLTQVSRTQPGDCRRPPARILTKSGSRSATASILRPGNPIHDDCGTVTTPSGVPVTGQALVNLQIACGANPDPFRTNFPGVGSVSGLREQASSSYNALEASVRRNVGGLQLSLAYTYSHSIDDSSSARDAIILNSDDLARARASSNFDQRHMFNLGYVYDLPFFKNPGLASKILGGWQWSGIVTLQSGTPFSPANGVFGDNAGVANGISVELCPVIS